MPSKLTQWLRSAPHLYLILLFLGVLLAKNGTGLHPAHAALYEIAVNWNTPSNIPYLGTQQDYITPNGLIALLAGALQLTHPLLYGAWHAILLLATLSLALLMPQVRQNRDKFLLTLTLLIATAAPAALLTWREGYDTLLMAGLTIAALSRRSWLSITAWLFAALNHPSITMIAVLMWSIVYLSTQQNTPETRRLRTWKLPATTIAAAALGSAINQVATRLLYGTTTSRLDYVLLEGWDQYVQQFTNYWWLAAFSVLSVGWFILLDKTALQQSSTRVLLFASAALALLSPLIVLDPTRVPALAVLPALLWWVNKNPQIRDGDARVLWQRWMVPALITPTLIIWDSTIITAWTP